MKRLFKKLTKKTILVILAIIAIGAPLLYLTVLNQKEAVASWMDENWAYRQITTLTNNGSAQTNYQVQVVVDTSTLATAGKLQTSCNDLRFTDINGKLLNHWIEAGCNSANTLIWVTVPNLIAGSSNIYIYYGNPSASNISTFRTLPTGISVGNGADGTCTVSFDTNINSASCAGRGTADAIASTVSANTLSGQNQITVSSSTGLATGDEILVMDLQSSTAANYGRSETARISSIAGNTLTLNHNLASSYDGTADKIIVQRVPNYTSVTVNSTKTLNVSAWDGSKGGVVFFRANGTVTVSGTISAGSLGYRGGTAATNGPEDSTGYISSGGGGGGGGATTHNGATYTSYYPGKGVDGAMGGQVSYDYHDNWAPTYWSLSTYGAANTCRWATSDTRVACTEVGGYTEQMGGWGGTGITGGGGGGGGGGYAGFNGGTGGNSSTAGFGGGPSTNSNTSPVETGTDGSSGAGGGGGGGRRDNAGGGGGGKPYSAAANNSNSTLTTFVLGGGAAQGGGGGGGGGTGDYSAQGGGTGGSKDGTGGLKGTGSSASNGSNGANGNPGGGIVYISATTVTISGAIAANGGSGGAGGAGGAGTGGGGAGGAGGNGASGGSVRIDGVTVTLGSSLVTATVGSGGSAGSGGAGSAGGAGGSGAAGSTGSTGKIATYYSTTSGTTSPAATATVLPVSGSPASEEQGPGPIAYWKFDDGTGTTAYDSSSSKNNGTITSATWTTEGQCISGKCLYFPGTAKVTAGSSVSGVQTISFWVNPKTTTESIMDFDGGTHKITVASGVVTATGFSGTVVIYVNGKITSTLSANTWSHVAITTSTSFAGSAIKIGYDNSTYFNGFLDDVKVYPYVRTPAQIKTDYNAGAKAAAAKSGTSAALGGPSAASGRLADGLVGYWKMDETSGTLADSSGNSNTGTWYGTGSSHYSAGKFGNGGGFNGTDDYVNVPNSSALQLANSVSIVTWVKRTRDGLDLILEKGGDWTGSQTNYGVGLHNSSTSYMFYFFFNGGWRGTSGPSDYNWHHYVVVANNGDANPTLYIDGVQKTVSGSGGGSTISLNSSTTAALHIGAQVEATYNYYGANIIDEARIYNRALSPAEIRQLADWAPGPVGYWNFEEGSGGTVNDRSGYANTGTWYGTGTKHWDVGKIGKAGKFNGSDDYVRSISASLSPGVGDLTLEAWIKTTDPGTGTFLGIYTNGTGIVHCRVQSHMLLSRFNDDVAGPEAWASYTVVDDGVWHHVAVTYQRTSVMTGYVDGKKGLSTDISMAYRNMTTKNFHIGAEAANFRLYKGMIDEVRVYNYARTPAQILADYGTGLAQKQPMVYLKMDEGQGTANNSGTQGQALQGTVNSGTWTNSGKFNKGVSITGSSGSNISVPDFAY